MERVDRTVKAPAVDWARSQWRRLRRWPPKGAIEFGSLRRLQPISRVFGTDRGQCIDRYYIERFLSAHQDEIAGVVLEVGDATYTRRFGGSRVTKSDVLHLRAGEPGATLVGDLSDPLGLGAEVFDCIVLTQTLPFIYDTRAAVRTLHRMLKPGGVVLATCPGISQISRFDMDRWGDYWRFTTLSARRTFEEVFAPANVSVAACGNVLAAVAFLHGLAADELEPEELLYQDSDYELLITIRAVR
jgi:hypothetical protein